jgi:hypothetical protein
LPVKGLFKLLANGHPIHSKRFMATVAKRRGFGLFALADGDCFCLSHFKF